MNNMDINEVALTCPACFHQLETSENTLAEADSLKCSYCGEEVDTSSLELEDAGREEENYTVDGDMNQYVVGSWRKRNNVKSAFLAICKLCVLVLIVVLLGGGKIHDTYFVGIKKKPGIENTFVSSKPISTFGTNIVDRKIQRNFSYVVVRYSKKTGLVFFKEI